MGRLSGKIALITGGNSRIGLASAKAFEVVIAGCNKGAVDAAAREVDEGTAEGTAHKMMLKGSWRASKLIGLNVYNEGNEKLGDVNELILDKSGKVAAVVIGVGGFLGMGVIQSQANDFGQGFDLGTLALGLFRFDLSMQPF